MQQGVREYLSIYQKEPHKKGIQWTFSRKQTGQDEREHHSLPQDSSSSFSKSSMAATAAAAA
jgi:hypothetical protein